MRSIRGLHLLLAGIGLILLHEGAAAQGLELPRGLSIANQLEYAWDNDTEEPILENWTDLRYNHGAFSAGIRLAAFQPPDPTVSVERSSFQQNYRFVEAQSENGSLRAGHYYALFGQGLALNAYEERDLRVDQNLEGVRVTGMKGDFSVKLLTGTTAGGTAEDVDRPRPDRLHGADVEWANYDVGLTLGASAVRVQRDGQTPHNAQAVRLGFSYDNLYLEAEHVDLIKPGSNGEGIFASATYGIGPLQLLGEYKDYREITLRASDGTPYNLPPAVIREHTYTLLNRHPHVLDPDDETGFQAEATLTMGYHQLLVNYAETRNQDEDEASDNYLDELYGEGFFSLGELFGSHGVDVILAGDHQKLFEGNLPDPLTGDLSVPSFLETRTGVAELRVIANDVHSYRVQFETQHTESAFDGEYDTWFGLLEWSRSPDLTVNLVGETSNRSDEQLEEGESKDAFYGIVSLHLSENHDVSVLYGRRLEGFVCVGGVCRFEPEFEGVEVRLTSRW